MSVLIRNMKMPKCCDVCQFSDWSNLHQTALCKVYDYEPCFEDFSQEYTSKRSNNCPLVELPEKHGRLIDADELWEELGILYHQNNGKVTWNDALMEIKTTPTIEPQRKTGKWTPDNTNYYEERYICSECGRSYKVDMCMGKPMWKFCPNCGCRMDGGE